VATLVPNEWWYMYTAVCKVATMFWKLMSYYLSFSSEAILTQMSKKSLSKKRDESSDLTTNHKYFLSRMRGNIGNQASSS
jgi:hypothetical protein